MTALDWLAIVGGLAAIEWVLWYFFRAERGAAAPRHPLITDVRRTFL